MASLDVGDLRAAEAVLRTHEAMVGSEDASVAVHLLETKGSRDIVGARFFSARNIGLNTAGHIGMTPLHWAASLGLAEITAILVGPGADTAAQSWFLVTAVELAALNNQHEIIRLFRESEGVEVATISPREILERMRNSLPAVAGEQSPPASPNP